MSGYAGDGPSAIRPITQDDVDRGVYFRGVVNFGADVNLTFESAPQAGPQTVSIAAGGMYPFIFKPTALPDTTLYGALYLEKEAQ